ncbi:tetratricopeptide repeat protein [Rhizobium sp. BK251]|uniref:tetratricopeptide repeat protein n=1 Tax=Rhizobium sp. BK251 TaxID=2512125 RepID=UPI001048E8B0|nr:tetratricopeptide repeat protein [Rhizobium sp. BK251]TCL75712.1 tetratricopeptide repeat protein [Rhizobium sp. BK251]
MTNANTRSHFSRRLPLLVLGLGLVANSLPGLAFAIGDNDSMTPTCKKGQIYDKKTKKCVKQQGAVISDQNRTDYAYSLAKAGRYEEALAMLDTLKNPNTAEALNYRGYATRKLGRTDEGIAFYLQSVKMAPRYAKVREYLGEAYVIKGRVDLAKEQLNTIKGICGTGCEEYRDLNEAITSSKI